MSQRAIHRKARQPVWRDAETPKSCTCEVKPSIQATRVDEVGNLILQSEKVAFKRFETQHQHDMWGARWPEKPNGRISSLAGGTKGYLARRDVKGAFLNMGM